MREVDRCDGLLAEMRVIDDVWQAGWEAPLADDDVGILLQNRRGLRKEANVTTQRLQGRKEVIEPGFRRVLAEPHDPGDDRLFERRSWHDDRHLA